jgi:photosystem II stability/assembly factor-like uncharacterized protein
MKISYYILSVLFLYSSPLTAQWFPQNSGTTEAFADVSFSDANNGMAVGFFSPVVRTTNGGNDWISISTGGFHVRGISVPSSNIAFIAGYNNSTGTAQISRSTDGGMTWGSIQTLPLNDFNDIEFKDNDNGVVIGTNVMLTTDSGLNWITPANFPLTPFLWDVDYTGNNLSTVGWSGSIYTSSDGGMNWVEQNSGVSVDLYGIDFINSSIGFAVGENGTILKTIDGGINWTLQTSNTSNRLNDVSFTDVNNGFIVGESGLILRTTNSGINWMQQESGTASSLTGVAMINSNICTVVGTFGTILRTTNGGTPVELISFTASTKDNNVNLMWITASEINNSGFEILRFTQNDNDWLRIGFVEGKGTTTEQQFYSFTDKNLSSGKYQYQLKQIDFDGLFDYSDIVEVELGLPNEFSLLQNYPNPFNPSTKIKYTVPQTPNPFGKGQGVRLIVYDVLGNEIATLVNEEKEPGVYEVEFDGNNLSSGIYIYQLKAGSFVSSKKMTVVK